MKMKTPFEPVVLACNLAKIHRDPAGILGSRQQMGQAALASLLGITETAVNQWYWRQKPVSVTYCVRIEQLTHGVVTRQMLRPDDWHLIWPDLPEPRNE